MKTKMALRLAVAFILLTDVCAASFAVAIEQEQKSIVTDTSQVKFSTTNLSAKYVAGGNWIGDRPETISPSLDFSLTMTKKRVTTEERIELSFANIKKIVMDNAEVPKEIQSLLKDINEKPIRVSLRNGTEMFFFYNLMIEVGVDGNKKKTEYTSYSIKSERGYYLSEFIGRAKSENGTEGRFAIQRNETASILFE